MGEPGNLRIVSRSRTGDNSSMQTFKRVSAVVGLIVVILFCLVLWKFPEQELKRLQMDYEIQSPEDTLLKHRKQILADREELSTYDIFRPSKGERDAGPYLNPMVSWDNRPSPVLALPPELKAGLKGKDWVAFSPDFKAHKLDFSWMKKLHEFDHWSPDLNNPLIKLAEKPLPMTLPFPEYSELIHWAKLRLIHGRVTKDMKSALADVRQLARLIFTNDYLVSTMVTISLLRSEGQFIQNYNPKISEGWKAVPESVTAIARRYFWAQAEFVDPRLSSEGYETFSAGDVGKCQMISEGMLRNLIVRDYLKKFYPGQIKRFSETVKNALNICRPSLMNLVWNDPEWKVFGPSVKYEDALVKPENESNWKQKFLMIHPRVEEIYGFTILSTATPNYLKLYRELPPENE